MVIVGWKPGALKALRGQYCVQYILDDGSSHYVTDRGKVQRLGADEVEDLVTIMNKAFDKGRSLYVAHHSTSVAIRFVFN